MLFCYRFFIFLVMFSLLFGYFIFIVAIIFFALFVGAFLTPICITSRTTFVLIKVFYWLFFIIMFTFPLSLIGVVFALVITQTSINVIVLLGVIMLGGIVVNNGIVLIDYINILQRNGESVFDAVINASKARLRPILMTAMTTVLGLVPMALALGEGAELRAPLAISVMGGLFVTTFFFLGTILMRVPLCQL